MKNTIFAILLFILTSCNQNLHIHDGSYSMNINMVGASLNSKIDLVVSGNKVKYDGEIYDCIQFSDRIEIGEGKLTFTNVDGDLIVNVPTLGKVRYLKISGENKL